MCHDIPWDFMFQYTKGERVTCEEVKVEAGYVFGSMREQATAAGVLPNSFHRSAEFIWRSRSSFHACHQPKLKPKAAPIEPVPLFFGMASEEEPWYKAFPEPTETAPVFPQEKLLRMFQMVGDICNAGCLLIDLRRTDYEGGTIKGSLNIPAQSFYYNMAVLYRLCRGDGVNVISRVLFYCGMVLTPIPSRRSYSLPVL